MSSFFKKIQKKDELNILIKSSLIEQLSNNVKEIQMQLNDVKRSVLCGNDAANSLCAILEAVFLHELKDTLIVKAKNVLSDKIDQPPDVSFWPLLLIFSHRDVIENILSSQQITTDIGCCRAWIRLVLNESSLSSYFDIMRKDMNALSAHYKKQAFMRDADLLEIAQRYIEGFENCAPFDLPYNSSLLNSWNHQTLLAAGIWAQPMKSHPISSAVDIVNTLPQETAQISIYSLQSTSFGENHGSSSSKIDDILAINEQAAFEQILSKSLKKMKVANVHLADQEKEDVDQAPYRPQELLSSLGNSLCGKSAWSEQSKSSTVIMDIEKMNPSTSHQILFLNQNIDASSYNALLESYSVNVIKSVSSPDIKSIWENFYQQLSSTTKKSEELDATSPELKEFEIIPNSLSSTFSLQELQILVEQLCQLAREHGLDSQSYTCKSCSNSLGINFSKEQVCAFTGSYHCECCMCTDLFIIPARMVYNWDFHRYHVSQISARFLKEFQHHPLIDIKILNPNVYNVVDEMAQLQTLRIQLNFIRAYLFTCKEPIIEELQKKLWPRDYLYEHVHLYSIFDLTQIPGGHLKQEILKVVHFGVAHIVGCCLCSQKGYICEICNDPKVLFPFNLESTLQCKVCNAVYHTKCFNSGDGCVKCARRKKSKYLASSSTLGSR